MKKFVAVGALSLLFSSMPVAAFGIAVSSSEGSISGHAIKWYRGGADMSVGLTSKKGNPVYGSGMTVYDNLLDDTWARFTSDSGGSSQRDGRIGYANNSGILDGVAIKVCRNTNSAPDTCSSSSGTTWSPYR